MNKPAGRLVLPAQVDFRACFTTPEFVRMVELGVFADMKIELFGGALQRMNPPMNMHGARQLGLGSDLRQVFRDDPEIAAFVEVGVNLGDDTILVCDVAVARTKLDERRFLRADELLLAVEIADTTLARDMGAKRIAYATAAIPHYWVIDVERGVVHVYGGPVAGDYAAINSVRFGEPLAVPGTERTIILD